MKNCNCELDCLHHGCIVLVIALVSSILAIVVICTATVIFLLYIARWRNKYDTSSSSGSSSSWWSFTSSNKTTAKYPQKDRVWKPNPGLFHHPSSIVQSFICSEQYKKTSKCTIQCRTEHKGMKHLQVPETKPIDKNTKIIKKC